MNSERFSLYVHVPFCARKCPYCDFNTYAVQRIPEEAYVAALVRDLSRYAQDPRFQGRELQSIFFGGGTPSILSGAAIGEVISSAYRHFRISPDAEITIEANPNHAQPDRLASLKAAGVNRVSFGVQSFSNEQLALLGRDHLAEDARNAIQTTCEAGIVNVSLDIIFGTPGQTLKELERDLECASALPIKHVSTYALTIEPGTPFYQRQQRGLLSMPNDGDVAQMLEFIPPFLESRGFSRYEISNYAKPGSESTHNQAYWLGHDYIGIGAGAHSYCGLYQNGTLISAERWSTLALPESYMQALTHSAGHSWRETISKNSLQFEFFYLGLRMTKGVSVQAFESRFAESFDSTYGGLVQELVKEGFLELSKGILRLTPQGVLVADSVFERLIREDGESNTTT